MSTGAPQGEGPGGLTDSAVQQAHDSMHMAEHQAKSAATPHNPGLNDATVQAEGEFMKTAEGHPQAGQEVRPEKHALKE